MGSFAEIKCRLCGSTEYDIIDTKIAGAPEAAVYQCKVCTLVYLFPIMTEEEEAAFYQNEFEIYMGGRAGLSWKSPHQHFYSYQAEGERRLPLVRPYLHQTDSVLEIGSSTGYFLDYLRGYVKSVIGIEPSDIYRSFANERGLVTLSTLDELGDQRFEVIALYYVVEHLRHPVEYLSRLQSRLKTGGRVLLEVPNVDDVLLSRYHIPGFAPFYWQKAHYHNFSHRTLGDVLRRAGYTYELFSVQRYDLSNHMVWMMEGKPGGMGRYKEFFTPELEIAYAEALKAKWLCDTIFAVATLQP